MSHPDLQPSTHPPVTALRRSFERARALEPVAQIQECVDRLTHPGQVSEQVLDAYRVMESCFDGDLDDLAAKPEAEEAPRSDPPERGGTVVEDFFWKTRELMVLGDHASFTCLATNVHPLTSRTPSANRLSEGLDYVGLTCDPSAVIALGAVQAPGDSTAYPLLLRLLACLAEIAPAAQLERMNREHFMGIANESTLYDLNLVLWDRSDEPEMTPISQLTRDLAENVKRAICESDRFPSILRGIVCLKMNPERFDGRMRFDWRV